MAVKYRDDEPDVDIRDANYDALPEYYLFEEDEVRTHVYPYNPYFLEMHAAVLHSNIDGLRRVLDSEGYMFEFGIDQVTEYRETALHYATRFGDRACTKLLLERGASLEAVDDIGLTPLHNVCEFGYVKTMELLLKCARSRDSGCVKRMVEAVDEDGETPLHLAARHGYTKCIRVLLASGADPKKTNIDGKVPGELAPLKSEARELLESAVSAYIHPNN